MKLLKEADKNALYERALYDIDVLTEGTGPSIKMTDDRVIVKGTASSISDLKLDWSTVGTKKTFDASNINLTSCEGFPKRYSGSIILSHNQLKSLKGMPEMVYGEVWLHGNKLLESLEGAPRLCDRFSIANCEKIKSFEGGPEAADDIDAARCWDLESLKGLPNRLKTLDFTSMKQVKFDCDVLQGGEVSFDIPNTSLKGIEKAFKGARTIAVGKTPIKSHVLGLLKIDGLTSVHCHEDNKTLTEVFKIVNKRLPSTGHMGAILDCQDELLEAGFDEFAKL